jgi:hypothetical protein
MNFFFNEPKPIIVNLKNVNPEDLVNAESIYICTQPAHDGSIVYESLPDNLLSITPDQLKKMYEGSRFSNGFVKITKKHNGGKKSRRKKNIRKKCKTKHKRRKHRSVR